MKNSIRPTSAHHQDWLESGVPADIIDLNVEAIAGIELFDFLFPNPQRLNAGRLNAHYMRLWERCVDSDGFTPLSYGWHCNGRVKLLGGPLLDPSEKGGKYRNPQGGAAPITFLKVPTRLLDLYRKLKPIGLEQIEVNKTEAGKGFDFWDWVHEAGIGLVLTEGEKKAGCLLNRGYAAVSIPGISMGWRSEKDALGRTIARELHPDLSRFDDGREITIAFDYRPGNWFESKEFKSASILARLFKKSTVKIAQLPGPQKGIDDFAITGGDVDRVLAEAETAKYLQDERLWRAYKGFSPNKVVNQRYLDLEAPEKGKITAIKSGLGTGKTQYLADKVAPGDGRQLNIGYRNSLLLQMSEKLNSYHLDAHNGYQMMNDPNARLSFCWDSLLKVLGVTFDGATLTLDEASSSIKHLLTSNTCKDKRLEILDYLKAIAPTVDRVVMTDGMMSDWVVDYIAEIFKMPVVKVENRFKGDTPPVFILELENGKVKPGKKEAEWLAGEILNAPCPVIATDSLNEAEALARLLRAEGREGILLTSKTVTQDWAKDFLACPDRYIQATKPQWLIFTPTAESGLDISIKGYFSDVYCWFYGVVGVDECLQMSRRVRHPERIVICCAERGLVGKGGSDSLYYKQIIKTIKEQVEAEAILLTDVGSLTEAAKVAIATQSQSPDMIAWSHIESKASVERRNLRRFLVKSYEEGGYSVSRVNFEELISEVHMEAKLLCRKEEARQIFEAEDITLTEALEIERNFNAQWSDRCKALKAKLKARLPGIETLELWSWEFVHRVRFEERDLLNQLEADWLFKNPESAEYLQRQKWKHEFNAFLPDLSDRWLKLKLLSQLGIEKFLAPGVAWTNESPEVKELVKQCRKKSAAALLGHPGKLAPIQYLNKLLKTFGTRLIGTQVRDGDRQLREYRYEAGAEGKKSSRPENWDELYPLISQKMTEKVVSARMAETATSSEFEFATTTPLNIKTEAGDETKSPPPIAESAWGWCQRWGEWVRCRWDGFWNEHGTQYQVWLEGASGWGEVNAWPENVRWES